MARAWFSSKTSEGLTNTDASILNNAVRHLVDDHGMQPTHRRLMDIRMDYQPGMSAKDIIEKYSEILERENP